MRKGGYSRLGVFGTMNHYDNSGYKIGESRPGLFGSVNTYDSKVSSIEDNQDTVNALMKKLKNPPDEYKDAYDAVSDLYDAYISFTNCATDPSGSLQTYSSTVNDADTNTLNAYKALELYLDD